MTSNYFLTAGAAEPLPGPGLPVWQAWRLPLTPRVRQAPPLAWPSRRPWLVLALGFAFGLHGRLGFCALTAGFVRGAGAGVAATGAGAATVAAGLVTSAGLAGVAAGVWAKAKETERGGNGKGNDIFQHDESPFS